MGSLTASTARRRAERATQTTDRAGGNRVGPPRVFTDVGTSFVTLDPGPVPTAAEGAWSASFVQLYRTQYEPMVRLAYLLTGANTVAEDVVQEAFVRTRGRLGQVDHPVAYLRAAVVNGCRNQGRRAALERRKRPDPPAHAFEAEVDELGDALARLPLRQRAVIVLRFYADLSEADIAAALGCRPGTVKSLASRGLAQLRKVVEP